MTYERYCKQCGTKFEANRFDATFCSPKCTAQFYRDNRNPDNIHAAKDHVHWFNCDECWQGFVVNDYAKRGGKRTPRFCSTKCKQKAYRQRVSDQAARRQEDTTRPSGSTAGGSQDAKHGHSRKAGQSENQHSQDKPPKQRHNARRDPYDVLGVERGMPKAMIKRAWLRLISKWHPDRNPDNLVEATRMTQEINDAYDRIGR